MLVCPVASPCRVTQHYNGRPDYYKKYGLKAHGGLDLTGPHPGVPVPVYAPVEGRVIQAGSEGSLGLCVRIITSPNFDSIQREVVLGHLKSISVKFNQYVALGEEVGIMGKTGDADGVHVHFAHRLWKYGKVLNANNGYKGYLPFGPKEDSEDYVLFWGDPKSLVTYPFN